MDAKSPFSNISLWPYLNSAYGEIPETPFLRPLRPVTQVLGAVKAPWASLLGRP